MKRLPIVTKHKAKAKANPNINLMDLNLPLTNGLPTPDIIDILEKVVDEKYYLKQETVDKILKGSKVYTTKDQSVCDFNRKDGVGRERDVANTLNSSDWRGLNRNQTQNAVVKQEVLAYSKSTRENGRVEKRVRIDGTANTLNTGDGGSSQSTSNYVKEE